jgi:hypothetical protein
MEQKYISIEAPWRCPWNVCSNEYYCSHQDGPAICSDKKFPAKCPLRVHEYIIRLAAAAIVEET